MKKFNIGENVKVVSKYNFNGFKGIVVGYIASGNVAVLFPGIKEYGHDFNGFSTTDGIKLFAKNKNGYFFEEDQLISLDKPVFNIGDRVIAIENINGNNTKNKYGTVIKIDGSVYTVQFDERLEDGWDEDKSHTKWNCYPTQIHHTDVPAPKKEINDVVKLVEVDEVKIITDRTVDGDITNKKTYNQTRDWVVTFAGDTTVAVLDGKFTGTAKWDGTGKYSRMIGRKLAMYRARLEDLKSQIEDVKEGK